LARVIEPIPRSQRRGPNHIHRRPNQRELIRGRRRQRPADNRRPQRHIRTAELHIPRGHHRRLTRIERPLRGHRNVLRPTLRATQRDVAAAQLKLPRHRAAAAQRELLPGTHRRIAVRRHAGHGHVALRPRDIHRAHRRHRARHLRISRSLNRHVATGLQVTTKTHTATRRCGRDITHRRRRAERHIADRRRGKQPRTLNPAKRDACTRADRDVLTERQRAATVHRTARVDRREAEAEERAGQRRGAAGGQRRVAVDEFAIQRQRAARSGLQISLTGHRAADIEIAARRSQRDIGIRADSTACRQVATRRHVELVSRRSVTDDRRIARSRHADRRAGRERAAHIHVACTVVSLRLQRNRAAGLRGTHRDVIARRRIQCARHVAARRELRIAAHRRRAGERERLPHVRIQIALRRDIRRTRVTAGRRQRQIACRVNVGERDIARGIDRRRAACVIRTSHADIACRLQHQRAERRSRAAERHVTAASVTIRGHGKIAGHRLHAAQARAVATRHRDARALQRTGQCEVVRSIQRRRLSKRRRARAVDIVRCRQRAAKLTRERTGQHDVAARLHGHVSRRVDRATELRIERGREIQRARRGRGAASVNESPVVNEPLTSTSRAPLNVTRPGAVAAPVIAASPPPALPLARGAVATERTDNVRLHAPGQRDVALRRVVRRLRKRLRAGTTDIAARRHKAVRLADQQTVQQRIAARTQRCVANRTRARAERQVETRRDGQFAAAVDTARRVQTALPRIEHRVADRLDRACGVDIVLCVNADGRAARDLARRRYGHIVLRRRRHSTRCGNGTVDREIAGAISRIRAVRVQRDGAGGFDVVHADRGRLRECHRARAADVTTRRDDALPLPGKHAGHVDVARCVERRIECSRGRSAKIDVGTGLHVERAVARDRARRTDIAVLRGQRGVISRLNRSAKADVLTGVHRHPRTAGDRTGDVQILSRRKREARCRLHRTGQIRVATGTDVRHEAERAGRRAPNRAAGRQRAIALRNHRTVHRQILAGVDSQVAERGSTLRTEVDRLRCIDQQVVAGLNVAGTRQRSRRVRQCDVAIRRDAACDRRVAAARHAQRVRTLQRAIDRRVAARSQRRRRQRSNQAVDRQRAAIRRNLERRVRLHVVQRDGMTCSQRDAGALQRTGHRQIVRGGNVRILDEAAAAACDHVMSRAERRCPLPRQRAADGQVMPRRQRGIAGHARRARQRDILRAIDHKVRRAVQRAARIHTAIHRCDRQVADRLHGAHCCHRNVALRRQRDLRATRQRTVDDHIACRLHVRRSNRSRVAVERHVTASGGIAGDAVRRNVECTTRLHIGEARVIARRHLQTIGEQLADEGDVLSRRQRAVLAERHRSTAGEIILSIEHAILLHDDYTRNVEVAPRAHLRIGANEQRTRYRDISRDIGCERRAACKRSAHR
ncbi:hypothetical protein KCU90_g1245, partial [Aureobasidium melanogenum]